MLIDEGVDHMLKPRNYWVYGIGCFLVWGILLALAAAEAKNGTFHNVLLVFAGCTLCWISRRSLGSCIRHPSDGNNGSNRRCSKSASDAGRRWGDGLPQFRRRAPGHRL